MTSTRQTDNEYEVHDDYAIIKLKRRNGEILNTYIDIEDLEKVLQYHWHVNWSYNTQSYYVRSTIYLGVDSNGKYKYKMIYLHRTIIDCNEDDFIDHRNNNTLDNRKENLRKTVNIKNTKNRKKRNSNNKSGYRNVSWNKDKGKWAVQLQINKRNKILGYFDDVDEAGGFAEEMRQKYYGEFKGKA